MSKVIKCMGKPIKKIALFCNKQIMGILYAKEQFTIVEEGEFITIYDGNYNDIRNNVYLSSSLDDYEIQYNPVIDGISINMI